MAPAARVVVDDDAWNADLAAATASGRLQLTNWRGRVQRDGLPIDQLLACGTAGADATSLAGCAKTRIPWPDGPWGAVFSFDIDNQSAAQTLTFRDGPDGKPMTSQFIFVRVRAAHEVPGHSAPPREEWLIAEWPTGAREPLDYWITNLPTDTPYEQIATLARLRWKIELDYRQLKGELGLDHYEGRSYLGWHHHTALVTAAHGFLTLERQHPNLPRPA